MAQKNKKDKKNKRGTGAEISVLSNSLKRLDKAIGLLIDAEADNFHWSPEARTTGKIAVDLACQTLNHLQKQINHELSFTE